MNKDVIKQKIEKIKGQLVKIVSEIKTKGKSFFENNNLKENLPDTIKDKMGVAYDYIVQNKITCTILIVLIIWNFFLSYILVTNFSTLNNLPTDYDFDKLEDEFENLRNKYDEFEDTYVYKIEDLLYTVETMKPRIDNLEDYSHTHY